MIVITRLRVLENHLGIRQGSDDSPVHYELEYRGERCLCFTVDEVQCRFRMLIEDGLVEIGRLTELGSIQGSEFCDVLFAVSVGLFEQVIGCFDGRSVRFVVSAVDDKE